MAHNLEIRDGKASFAAKGEIAWHGLGTYVQEAMTAEEAIRLGRLDFTVKKTPIQVVGGKEIPKHYATVRTDTGDALGIVKSSYEIVQNTEAFSFFDTIIDRGEAIFETAGVLGRGERIFITAKLPNDIVVNGDKIENYLLLTSGHTGYTPVQIGFTPIRVVCNNTLTSALRGLSNKMTIHHYSTAKQKLATAASVMGLSSTYTKELNDIFTKMANVKIDEKQTRAFIEEVMQQDVDDTPSKYLQNRMDEAFDFALCHDTQKTDAAKNTVFGAYNAISGYYGWIKNYKNADDRFQDSLWKTGSKKIQKAFDLALELC